MLTVKKAKEMGVVFVKGDFVRDNANHKLSSSGLWLINESHVLDHCQVIEFTDRKHTGDEMPCDWGFSVVVELHRGTTQTGRNAYCFNWSIEGVSGDITSWKPDLEALEKLANEKEEKPMTPCEKLGYKVGDRFIVNGSNAFTDGSLVELDRDDKTMLPLFKLISGDCGYDLANNDQMCAYCSLEYVQKEQKPVIQKQFAYELVTDLTTDEIAKAMIDGEVFYTRNGAHHYKWDGFEFVDEKDNHTRMVGEYCRRKEIEMVTRTITYPKPVSEPLNDGNEYWYIKRYGEIISSKWCDDAADNFRLKQNRIHLTKENAQAHWGALFGANNENN